MCERASPSASLHNLHRPTLVTKGERAISIFADVLHRLLEDLVLQRLLDQDSLQLGDSATRAAASSDAGTTSLPDDTTVNAPWRYNCRQLKNSLAEMPSWRATSDTAIPGS